jgi:hypothetical protein
MRIFLPFAFVSLVVTSALAQPQGRETVKVGPWTIATTYKGDKFDNCTMTNSAEGIGISFVRNADGLLLILDSPKWKLDRGKAYSVQLVTGSQTVEAKALAETKSVTIAITECSFQCATSRRECPPGKRRGRHPSRAPSWHCCGTSAA